MKKIFLMLCLVVGASPVALAQEQAGKALAPISALSVADAQYAFGGAGHTPAVAPLLTQEMENTRGGSDCRTYVDLVSGQEVEACRPPFFK